MLREFSVGAMGRKTKEMKIPFDCQVQKTRKMKMKIVLYFRIFCFLSLWLFSIHADNVTMQLADDNYLQNCAHGHAPNPDRQQAIVWQDSTLSQQPLSAALKCRSRSRKTITIRKVSITRL